MKSLSLPRCFVPLAVCVVLAGCAREAPAPRAPFALTHDERGYLMQLARRALDQYFRDGTEHEPTDAPASLRKHHKRVVFATYHVDGDTRGCYSANEAGLAANVVKAVVRTAHDDRYVVKGIKGPRGKPVTLRPEEVARVRLELNVLGNYERLAFNDADSLRGEIEPGVHGVKLAQGRSGAYYLPYVGIEFEYDVVPYMRTLAQKAKLPPDAWTKTATLWRFEADNFVEDGPGSGQALVLYRWNALAPEATKGTLREAVERASTWVVKTVAEPKSSLGWHPKRKRGTGEAPEWLVARALVVAETPRDRRSIPAQLIKAANWSFLAPPGAKTRKPVKSAETLNPPIPSNRANPSIPPKTPLSGEALKAAIASARANPLPKGAATPTPAAGQPLTRPLATPPAALPVAAKLAFECLGAPAVGRSATAPLSRRACATLATLVRADGTLEPASRAPFTAWQREHLDVLAVVRALAALPSGARPGRGAARGIDVAKTLYLAAEKTYAGRIHAAADLAVAALILRGADPDGDWLVRARGHGERLLPLQFTAESAPTPDQVGALLLEGAPTTSDVARAGFAFAMLVSAGEGRFRAPAMLAARFLLTLQYRSENAFAFPEVPRYFGGVRADLHHVAASLESTLDAIEAWRALAAVL